MGISRTSLARRKVPLYRVEEIVSFFAHFTVRRRRTCAWKFAGTLSCAQPRFRKGSRKKIEEIAKTSGKQILVEGVSCLGRCDQAPAMVVTRPTATTDSQKTSTSWLQPGGSSQSSRRSSARSSPAKASTPTTTRNTSMPLRAGSRGRSMSTAGNRSWSRTPPSRSSSRSARPRLRRRRVRQHELDRTGGGQARVPRADGHRRSLARGSQNAYLLGMEGARAAGHGRQRWRDDLSSQGAGEVHRRQRRREQAGSSFKDREIMLRTPELLVESVIMAGLITGATQGYIYIRHEYEEAIHSVEECIKQAIREGACGPSILGTPTGVSRGSLRQPRRLHLRRAERPHRGDGGSPGSAAESTAGMSANGLRNQPTLVNNVVSSRGHRLIFLEEATGTRSSRAPRLRPARAGGSSRSAATRRPRR